MHSLMSVIMQFAIKKMKKRSRFFQPKLKKARQLAIKLDLMHIENEREMANALRSQRREKSNEHNYIKELELPRFSPLKKSYEKFSYQSPISTGESFLLQKQKSKILSSTRAFSSLPNMKVSKLIKKPISQTQNPVIRNLKFLEFDRIITQVTASDRITKIKSAEMLNLKTNFSTTQFERSSRKSKLSLDESDFRDLKPLRFDKIISPGLMSQRLKHSSKGINTLRQTKDSSSSRQFHSLDQSAMRQSSVFKKKLDHLKTNRVQVNSKDLRRTPTLSKAGTTKLDKSINSFMLK